MKIGVVGTFIRDRIFPWQGEEVASIGGIFFTVSYLANLMQPDDEVYPVCFLGSDFYEEVVGRLAAYPNVRFDGLKKVAHRNTQVKLIYTGPQEREEVTTAPMPPLGEEELQVLDGVDAIVVNLITGSDVALPALNRLREKTAALLYLDFHSHALGISAEGKRFYRRPTDWQEWVRLVDVLQLNEMEARTLAGLGLDASVERLAGFGKSLLGMGPKICHITLAERGSMLFYRHSDDVQVHRFPAHEVARVVDIIGCGDAFASAFVVSYLKDRDEIAATELANKVAALNCTFLGSSGIPEIKSRL